VFRFRVRLRYADVLWVNRLWQRGRGRGRRCATIRRKPYLEYHAAIPRAWLRSLSSTGSVQNPI